MVVFTCNICGESVKKTSVEKHYNTRCLHNPKNVSCMDCQKDFHGEEYAAHIKCITEAEKYSGKNYVAKDNKNSGQKRQETWMDIVRSILESTEYQLSAETRNVFQRLQQFDNVPRKKAKFQNFVANCMRIPVKKAEPVWIVLEKELEIMKQARQQEVAAAKAAIVEANKAKEAETKPNDLKRKAENSNEEEPEVKVENKKKKNDKDSEPAKENNEKEIIEEEETFQWSTVLEKLVAKHPEGLSVDKLKNKLLNKYKNKLNLQELSDKQQKKFEKKFSNTLEKAPTVQVDNEMVKPC